MSEGSTGPDLASRIDDYIAQKELRDDFVQELCTFTDTLLRAAGIELSAVKGRVKSAHSYARHLVANPSGALREDLTGLRVIVLFPPDVDRAIGALKDTFGDSPQVYKGESNRTDSLNPWEFAYRSHHVKFRPINLSLPGGVPEIVRDEWLEFQIRTLAEDVWGVVDHRLRYKAPFPLSDSQQRTLFRTAALLESVDRELDSLMAGLVTTASQGGLDVRAGKYTTQVSAAGVRAMVFDDPDVALALCKATVHGWELLSREGHEYEPGGHMGSAAELSEADSCQVLAKTAQRCGAVTMSDVKALALQVLKDEHTLNELIDEAKQRGLHTKSFPADLISLAVHATQPCPINAVFDAWQPAIDAIRERHLTPPAGAE